MDVLSTPGYVHAIIRVGSLSFGRHSDLHLILDAENKDVEKIYVRKVDRSVVEPGQEIYEDAVKESQPSRRIGLPHSPHRSYQEKLGRDIDHQPNGAFL
jgi:hypothetical protein